MALPYFLRLAYLGTGFHGWQIQTSLRSVQSQLWKALRAFDPLAPMPQGTGRTDAGVHAQAQGVLVHLNRPWDPFRLQAAINAHLPPEIRVMGAQEAPEGFFPRQHAVAKRYVYRIQEGPAEDPFAHGRCWHIKGLTPLDRNAMARAGLALIGEHDFSSFRHKECVAKTPLRLIHAVRIEGSWPRMDLVFEGNRFLMHQVRIMTGTLVDIGRGRIREDAMDAILAARDRTQAGHTAPPQGLCLEEVWYQSRWGIGAPSPWGEPDLIPEPGPAVLH